MRRILAVLAFVLLAPLAGADVVELTGGTRLEGDVLESGTRGVRILLPGGAEISLTKADVKAVTIEPDAPGGAHFTRYSGEGAKPGLQTGLVHYEKAGAPRVDLVGAVHVADASYYDEIQAVLDRADVVLYEMVRNVDRRAPAKPAPVPDTVGEGLTALGKFQRRLGEMLDLSFQADGIDYRRKHFLHADMTLDEFLAQGGDKFSAELAAQMALVAPLLDLISNVLAPPEGASEFSKYLAKGIRARVKPMIAEMIGSMGDESGMVLGGVDMDELIISKRNEVCMAMFDVVQRNRAAKSIAIFYGSGHMPDFEKRLLARGYAKVGGRWLTAWDVSSKPAGLSSKAPPAPAAPALPLPAPTPAPAMN